MTKKLLNYTFFTDVLVPQYYAWELLQDLVLLKTQGPKLCLDFQYCNYFNSTAVSLPSATPGYKATLLLASPPLYAWV